MPWTHGRLLKAAWRRLNDPAVRLSPHRLRDCAAKLEAPSARSLMSGRGPRHVKFDAFKVGIIQGVIHELLHDSLEPAFGKLFGKTVRETFVEALENDLAEMVLSDAERTERWRMAIIRRVESTKRETA